MNEPTPKINRESWLERAVEKLTPLFKQAELTVPELRVSCGFPSKCALATKKRRIGECWDGLMSADGKPQLFISPMLVSTDDECGVLATLVHEMVHASIGGKAGHGPKFKKAMAKVFLSGKPTATVASAELVERLKAIALELGPYPHSELKLVKERKVQTTRMHKCACPECDYTIRLTRKWLDVGIPNCPVEGHPKLAEEQQEEQENE